MMITAAAGPLANVVLAVLGAVALGLVAAVLARCAGGARLGPSRRC